MGILFDHYGEVLPAPDPDPEPTPSQARLRDLYTRAQLANLQGHTAMSIVHAIRDGDLEKASEIAREIADDHYRDYAMLTEEVEQAEVHALYTQDPAWVEDAQEDPTLPDHP